MAPSTSLCAYDGSFAAGLLETAVQTLTSKAATLLVSSDAPYPEPLNSVRPMSAGFGVGLVISARQSEKSVARLTLSLTQETPSTLPQLELERIRLDSPAARALPLLVRLASGTSDRSLVHLDYLANCSLTLQVESV